MTGLEMATAAAQKAGVAWFVFNDGELAQIAQVQETPYNRKTCTVLPPLDLEGLARASHVSYRLMRDDGDAEPVVADALATAAAGDPVVVDVRIDYSKRTRFTEGVIRTNLKRFGLADQARLVGRALWRRITG
jgi:acetolactate synthase I/II/III large subunit